MIEALQGPVRPPVLWIKKVSDPVFNTDASWRSLPLFHTFSDHQPGFICIFNHKRVAAAPRANPTEADHNQEIAKQIQSGLYPVEAEIVFCRVDRV
jgi:hypothetical protein